MLVFRKILRTYLMDDPEVSRTKFRFKKNLQSNFSNTIMPYPKNRNEGLTKTVIELLGNELVKAYADSSNDSKSSFAPS